MDHFIELNRGFQTAFVDHNINSNVAFRPEFLSNDRFRGKKVIVSLERELLNCEEFQISVAFITKSGITPLLQTLKELEFYIYKKKPVSWLLSLIKLILTPF